eukprot:GILJ01008323.1.p1 GENE.GILJ01008323.1~~GILJ01008323.1.p1  ORF type:complete len:545 (-),score=27.45 GILJ01008323.1:118-1713(-)
MAFVLVLPFVLEDNPYALGIVARVCRDLRSICSDEYLRLPEIAPSSGRNLWSLISSRPLQVTSLDLRLLQDPDITSIFNANVLRSMPFLSTLRFKNARICPAFLQVLVQSCFRLEALHFHECIFSDPRDPSWSSVGNFRLVHFSLFSVTYAAPTEFFISVCIASAASLQSLHLKVETCAIDDATFQFLQVIPLPRLETLSLNGTSITSNTLQLCASRMPLLAALDLSGSMLDDRVGSVLTLFPNLKEFRAEHSLAVAHGGDILNFAHLKLSSLTLPPSAELGPENTLGVLSKLSPTLKCLDVSDLVSQAVLFETICLRFAQLQSLNIQKCSIDSLGHIGQLQQLRCLHVGFKNSRSISADFLQGLSRLICLRELCMTNISFTDRAAVALGQALPKIQKFSLCDYSCNTPVISPAAVVHLLSVWRHRLVAFELYAASCHSHLAHILNALRQLESLEYLSLRAIASGDQDLVPFMYKVIQHCRSLRRFPMHPSLLSLPLPEVARLKALVATKPWLSISNVHFYEKDVWTFSSG